jgi:hypothetical protein
MVEHFDIMNYERIPKAIMKYNPNGKKNMKI